MALPVLPAPPVLTTQSSPANFIRVGFTNRGMSKVMNSPTSLALNSPDKRMVLNTAQILKDIKLEKREGIGFTSIPELIGIDYVGYIVDKERVDKNTGAWIRTDEYKIIGSKINQFKDSRVAYGNQYRYRIKSIIKVTVKVAKKSYENLELLEDLRRYEKDRIKENLRVHQNVISNIDRVTNLGLRSKSSRGTPIQTLDIIDGLKISSTSERTELISVPIDPSYSKIRDLRINKNLGSISPEFAKGTISRGNLQKALNDNMSKVQQDTVEYKSFYYESDASKMWTYVDVAENVPPPPPSSIKIIPNSTKKQICVTWLKPSNSQRDIKYFRLYKRREVGDRWQLLDQLDENENVYVDDVLLWRRSGTTDQLDPDPWIYALSCVDAHGYESMLSTQIQAQLNPNYAVEKEEKKLKWISGSGVKPGEINVVLKRFLDQGEPVVAKSGVSFSPSIHFNGAEKNLIIRVTSLDTHEQKEFKVTLRNVNVRDGER